MFEYPAHLPDWSLKSQWILTSYHHWTGRHLIDPNETPEEQARQLFEAPFAVLAHGTQSDPILMYANRTTLELWEITLDELLQTPSRLTAEPIHRDERAQLLHRVTENGWIDDYSGIRISHTGKRFWIEQATVWNLRDEQAQPAGQAAMFTRWRPIESA